MSQAAVQVLPALGVEQQVPPPFAALEAFGMLGALGFISDDLGHYRISGLASADYILKVSFQAGSRIGIGVNRGPVRAWSVISPWTMYAPTAFHASGAKVLTMHAGEDTTGVNVSFTLAGTHSVRGRVQGLLDHHGINTGRVTLEDSTDKSFQRSASLDAQGNYTVNFVPLGRYNLTVSHAEDIQSGTARDKALTGNRPEVTRMYVDSLPMGIVVLDDDVTAQDVELRVDRSATTREDAVEQQEPQHGKLFVIYRGGSSAFLIPGSPFRSTR